MRAQVKRRPHVLGADAVALAKGGRRRRFARVQRINGMAAQ